jgi:sugar phosphate isomerase/epimerase
MNRRFGFLAGLDFIGRPADQVANSLAEAGYQAVSWPLAWFDPYSTTSEERRKLVQFTHQAGLHISEWVVQIDTIALDPGARRERLDHTIAALRCAAEMDPSAPVNMFTGPAPWDPKAPRLGKDLSEGEGWELLWGALDVLVPLAEKEGLRLAFEAVFGHLARDYYTSLELLRHYDSAALGVNYDPSHGVLVGNDIPWVVRQLGSRIFHVHLKDAVGRPGGLPGETFLFPLLGEGEVPWSEFLAALDATGYGGFLTVEFESFSYYKKILHNDPVAAARLSMDLLQKL